MKGVTTEQLALAKVYASAMIQLAESQGEMDLLYNELGDLANRIGNSAELESFLASPMIDRETREAALEKLFRGKYSDLLVDSLQVLNRKGRSGLVRAVVEAYAMAREERLGRIRVFVRSAAPLTEELRAGLRDVAGRYAGKEAELVEEIDETLIGGVIMQIGDEKFDGSVGTKLSRLTDAFRERASRELFGSRVHVEGAAAL